MTMLVRRSVLLAAVSAVSLVLGVTLYLWQADTPGGKNWASVDGRTESHKRTATLAVGAPLTPTEKNARMLQSVEAARNSGDPVEADRALRETMADLLLEPGGIEDAQNWLAGIPAGEDRRNALRTFEFAWANLEPAAALAWAARLKDQDERQEALTRIIVAEAASDPLKAISDAENSRVDEGSALINNLVQQWAAQDFTAARTWVMDRPAGEERDRNMARVALVQARSSPADAAQTVVDTIPPGAVLDGAVVSVVHQWVLRDPAAARTWVAKFPQGPLHDQAMRESAPETVSDQPTSRAGQ